MDMESFTPEKLMYSDERKIETEIFQSAIVLSIFRNHLENGHDTLALKGGFSMRTLANSHRLTDDVDLHASQKIPIQSLTRLIKQAKKEVESMGLAKSVSITHPKDTETTQRWKFHIVTNSDSHIHLKVEISRRSMGNASTTTIKPTIDSWSLASRHTGTPLGKIVSFDLPTICVNKLVATASLNRVAARDIYDLHIMMEMGVEFNPDLMKSIPDEKLDTIITEIMNKLEIIDYKLFLEQLANRLPKNESDAITHDRWEDMKIEVLEYCDKQITKERNRRQHDSLSP